MVKDPTAYSPPAEPAYPDLMLQTLYGATPLSAWAGLRVQATVNASPLRRGQWWAAAVRLLQQFAARHASLADWHRCAKTQDLARLGEQPLAAAWHSLQAALGLPDYPLTVHAASAPDAGSGPKPHPGRPAPLLDTACPYADCTTKGLQACVQLLQWARSVLDAGGSLQIPAADVNRWCASFDALPASLPAPDLRALHHRLWQQGVQWEWLGDARTRIGSGALQRVVSGVPAAASMAHPGVAA